MQPDRHDWRRLNHLQIGRYAEYLAKMEFTLLGFDVYAAEVDDKGIDFVVRRGVDDFFDVQVKSLRPRNGQGYAFLPKRCFDLRDTQLAVLVLFEEGHPPQLFLIPSRDWNSPTPLLVSRDYPGSNKSKPEWGIQISGKTRPLLARYAFEQQAKKLWDKRGS